MQYIECKDLNLHNLKNISVDIPKGQLTVITGVSGSGKSTLAFDILAHVGWTRYMAATGGGEDTTGDYNITGLSPTVCVSQNLTRQSNPRSTVGSRTKTIGLLRTLFAEIGEGGAPGLKLTPDMFSQYSAMGMCFYCYGRGGVPAEAIDEREFFREFMKSEKPAMDKLNRGLRVPFKQYCQEIGEDYNLPFSKLSTRAKEAVMYGDTYPYFKGTIPYYSAFGLHEYRPNDPTSKKCGMCGGTGLRPETRNIKIAGKTITEFSQMTIEELSCIVKEIYNINKNNAVVKHLVSGLILLTGHLIDTNLGYVTLSRKIPTLSGGEYQRLLLAGFFSIGLSDIIYIFDEPTMGLHESEKKNLIRKIKEITDRGDTVIMVEHDLGTLEYADYIIELGKGGGTEGGNIIFQGNYGEFLKSPDSVIRTAISKIKTTLSLDKNTAETENDYIGLEHITVHNLKDLSVSFPLHKLIGIAGMSGSGKSSLVSYGLVPLFHIKEVDSESDDSIEKNTEDNENYSPEHLSGTVKNAEKIKKALYVTQKPIGRSKKSIVGTYIGVFDDIRKIYVDEAIKMGRKYKLGHFSFNSEGACKKCLGAGKFNIAWTDFVCDVCGGTRYNPEVLEVRYKGYNIYDIQNLTIKEAIRLFDGELSANRKSNATVSNALKILNTLNDLCLGYLTLGQSTKTISGGEAQRIKLASELCTQNAVDYLYVLDEPTTGLSCYDTLALINILKRLVSKGNTVIIIEHDLQMLAACDHIIEMGPKSGLDGGKIVSEGCVDEIISDSKSIIAPYMKDFIVNSEKMEEI